MKRLLAFISFIILNISAAQAQEAPVVLELFTSQSCSSCPPADQYLTELAQHDNVIALGCHVTYWNHLHWKDTFSQLDCDERQYGYRDTLGNRNVFTPQMVINGTYSEIGSRRHKVKSAMNKAAKNPVLPVIMYLQNNDIIIELPETNLQKNMTLYLVRYRAGEEQAIPSGENRGRSVFYTNPVQVMKPVGTWDGRAETRTIAVGKATDGYAILAQEGVFGPIIAAGKL